MKKDIVIKTFAAVIVWKRVSMPITDKGLQKHNSEFFHYGEVCLYRR